MFRFRKEVHDQVIFVAALIFGPNTLPKDVTFTEFSVSDTRDLGPGYRSNELLNNVERMFEDEIKGPEGFAVLNGDLYTTLHGGYVAKVYDDQVIPVVKFGEQCEGWWEESKCGRPLGIKAVGNDLIVADSYYGIFKYNVKTKKVNKLVDRDVVIDGKQARTFNSVDVAKDGTIYWSHSSSHFTIEDGIFQFLADGTGRLMKYDPKTNSNTVLMKDLFFANGVLLSPNEDFVLVAESGHSRIHKYYLKGPKKFTNEIFIDGLPGVPDNLRAVGDDRLFVPLVTVKSEHSPLLFQTITHLPLLRKFCACFLSLLQTVLQKIDIIYPHNYFKNGVHLIGHLESISWAMPSNTSLLEVNWNGNIVRSYHGSDGSFPSLSDVMVHNGYLYLGSPLNKFLGRVQLTKLGEIIPDIETEVSRGVKHSSTQQSPQKPNTPPPTTRPKTTSPPPTTTARPRTTTPPPTTTTRPRTTPPPTTTTTKPKTSSAPPQRANTQPPKKNVAPSQDPEKPIR
ncbi:hypothetical protein RUM43_006971 [Polyplax serrata]|uniref:Strictosidine synthase conserved region domain-containing protein n=1 Tax=Polyplax serrata TaxID=468196 RepID=A0AAN8S8G9_POLSC